MAAILTAPVSAPVATVVAKPSTVTVSLSFEQMTKAQLGAYVKATHGYTAPVSWTKVKLIEAAKGDRAPRSGAAKAELRDAYTKAAGIAPAKTWTCAKLVTAVASTKEGATLIAPRGKGSKADAIALYVKATGYQPAKSWTIAQILTNAKAGKLPARNAVKA